MAQSNSVVRRAYKIQTSTDGTRHICIDAVNEAVIMNFLREDPARVKKFKYIAGLILEGLRITDLYDKEEINEHCKGVTAMKMFKGGQNIRLYCKEQTDDDGIFYVIVAELLPKKKDQRVKGISKSLIEKVGTYAYEIVERPASK